MDGRNNVVASWNAGAGELEGLARYDAEGNLIELAHDETVACAEPVGHRCNPPGGMPFGFNSMFRTMDGLYYMRNRWYAPKLAQFISHDPLEYVDTSNLYAFAAFDPVNKWDPWGLNSMESGGQHAAEPGTSALRDSNKRDDEERARDVRNANENIDRQYEELQRKRRLPSVQVNRNRQCSAAACDYPPRFYDFMIETTMEEIATGPLPGAAVKAGVLTLAGGFKVTQRAWDALGTKGQIAVYDAIEQGDVRLVDDLLRAAEDAVQPIRRGPNPQGGLRTSPAAIADEMNYGVDEINDAIHAVKEAKFGGSRRNPDVVVDTTTGKTYVKGPESGRAGEQIGNILEHLPKE